MVLQLQAVTGTPQQRQGQTTSKQNDSTVSPEDKLNRSRLYKRRLAYFHNRKRDEMCPSHSTSADEIPARGGRGTSSTLYRPPLRGRGRSRVYSPSISPANRTSQQFRYRANSSRGSLHRPWPTPPIERRLNSDNIENTCFSNTGSYSKMYHSSPDKTGGTYRPPPALEQRASPPLLRQYVEWKSWKEVTVKVMRLPDRITTLELYQRFKDEGEIIRIDINNRGRLNVCAFITFSPPPFRPFWVTNYLIGRHRLRIDLLSQRTFYTPSPVNPDHKYSENITIAAESIDFGFMHSEATMMVMRNAASKPRLPITFTFSLPRCEINIGFSIPIWNEVDNTYVVWHLRFRLKLSQLEHIYEQETFEDSKRVWIIPVDTPPSFYRKTSDIESTLNKNETTWREAQTWFRQTDITRFRCPLKEAPITLKKSNPMIDIGRWTTYRLEFSMTGPDRADYEMLCRALTDYNIKFVADKPIRLVERQKAQLWDIIDFPKLDTLGNLYDGRIALNFPIRYQLEVCVSHGYLNEHNISRPFLETLAAMDSTTAKNFLEKVADLQHHFYDPMEIFKLNLDRKTAEKPIPKYCAYARSATVTPSMIYYATPTIEISNRIIRQYSSYGDRFLRVKFAEERGEGKINSSEDDADNEVFTRIWRTLRNGITIGDRHYEFLAFGNSQFREQSAYFFASTDKLTAEHIRWQMGDFEEYKVVAKYAARLGQCFSTTRAVHGTTVKVTGIDDTWRNGYNFTDGVAKISRFLAQMIADEFGLPDAIDDPPSVFQFRLGGCKGVLAISPQLREREVHIRKSQYKFAAAHEGLEIVRLSQFAVGTLNRQIIVVLDALGIPNYVFISKLREMLSDLNAAVKSEDVALRLLQKNVDFNQMTLTVASMIVDGFMASNEPFMMSILWLWRSWNIKYLKEKAKIYIKDSAFLLGCVDETVTLRGHFSRYESGYISPSEKVLENVPEIFIQVSDPDAQGGYKVVEGICAVARNPSLHPGDIRVVRAVDVAALHHLKNVVVFPQTGDRDVPNMCSGGDLDGDDYLVIWDKDLIPKEINHPAMDFTPPQKTEVDGEITIEDISRFFIEYIKNDSLGRIATAHLANADLEDDGVKSEKCIALAQLHSLAVDYPKSGVPAKMTRDLQPKRFPHFMTSPYRPKHKFYKSEKILGKLYDEVEQVDFKPSYTAPFDSRILDAYVLSDAILTRAAKIKEAYDTAVRRLMAQYGIRTEFEVWTTFILDHNETNDYKMAEKFGRVSGALKQRFQNACFEEAGGKTFDILGPFVAAMYTVTAREIQGAVEECKKVKTVGGVRIPVRQMDKKTMPLMSFPWIFTKELGQIANGKDKERVGLVTVAQRPKHGMRAKKSAVSDIQDAYDAEDDILLGDGVIHHGDMMNLFPEQKHASKHDSPSGKTFEAAWQNEHSVLENARDNAITTIDKSYNNSIGLDGFASLPLPVSTDDSRLAGAHMPQPSSPSPVVEPAQGVLEMGDGVTATTPLSSSRSDICSPAVTRSLPHRSDENDSIATYLTEVTKKLSNLSISNNTSRTEHVSAPPDRDEQYLRIVLGGSNAKPPKSINTESDLDHSSPVSNGGQVLTENTHQNGAHKNMPASEVLPCSTTGVQQGQSPVEPPQPNASKESEYEEAEEVVIQLQRQDPWELLSNIVNN